MLGADAPPLAARQKGLPRHAWRQTPPRHPPCDPPACGAATLAPGAVMHDAKIG